MGADRLAGHAAVADALADCSEKDDIWWTAVELAEEVLAFDAAAFCVEERDQIRPEAVRVDRLYRGEFLDAGTGVIGETIQTGDPRLVEDLRDCESARPTDDSFRSLVSVPIPVDEPAAFQAIATEVGAFSEADLESARLLARQVAATLRRVGYETRLQRERDEFAALFENVPDPAIRYRQTDGPPRVQAVNSAFVRTFDYDPDRAVGEAVAELLPTDDTAEADLIASGRRTEREVDRAAGATDRRFLLVNVPVDAEDDRRGYLIYVDVDELKRRERELRQQNERLEKFATVLSHDLRNPIEVADGYLEVARETGDPEHFEEIAVALQRMESLIDEVLAVARQGQTVMETEPVDVGTVAERAWETVRTEGATLEVADSRPVESDADRLVQLFENLFRNAIEHGSTGSQAESGEAIEDGRSREGETVSVRIGTTDNGFFVEDDGPGIPPEERDEVFEFGHTTAADGTGIGLATVEGIAGAHGWTVSVTEGTDGGARFEFETAPDPGEGADTARGIGQSG